MNNNQQSQSHSISLPQSPLDLVNPNELYAVQSWPQQSPPMYQLSPVDQMAQASGNGSQAMMAAYTPEQIMHRLQALQQEEIMLRQHLRQSDISQSPRQSVQPLLQQSQPNTSQSMQSPLLQQSSTSMQMSQSMMVAPVLPSSGPQSATLISSSPRTSQSFQFAPPNNHPQSHGMPPRGYQFQQPSVSSTPRPIAPATTTDHEAELVEQAVMTLLSIKQKLKDPTRAAEAATVLAHNFSHSGWPDKVQYEIFQCLWYVMTSMEPIVVKKVLQRYTSRRFHWKNARWSQIIDASYDAAKQASESPNPSNYQTPNSNQANLTLSAPSLPVLAPASAFVSPSHSTIQSSSITASSGQSLPMTMVTSLQQAPQHLRSSPQQNSSLTPLPLNVPRPFTNTAPKKVNSPQLTFPLNSIPRPHPPPYDPLMFADRSLKTKASTNDTPLLHDTSPNAPIYYRFLSLPHPPFRLVKNRLLTQAPFDLPEAWHRRLWMGPSQKRKDGRFNDPENYPPQQAVDEELPLSLRLVSFRRNAQLGLANVGRGGIEDKIEWSEKVAVEVNGVSIDPPKKRRIPGRLPQTVLYVGQHAPVDITPLLKSGTNTVVIGKYDCDDAHYGEFVYCIQAFVRESVAVILQRLRTRLAPVSDTNRLIAQTLGPLPRQAEQEDEVSVLESNVKMSLICPLSRSRIKSPIRSKLCQHIGCFDFQPYVDMNKGMLAKWSCPICGVRATSDLLVLCQLTSAILLDPENKNVAVMEFTGVGQYRPSEMISTSKEDSDDGSDGFESSRAARRTQDERKSRGESPLVESRRVNTEVVDLTAEDNIMAPT